ncbi:MAG: 50S ribosomal protein L25 [Patescibacteria group bacterium]|jgi:large subunit ribosomal protein L25
MNKPAEKLELSAEIRDTSISPKAFRTQGKVPGVAYGKDVVPTPLAVKLLDFKKIYRSAGETTIINLKLGDALPKMVLIKDVQLSPDQDEYLNIDFLQIKVGEKLRVTVPLKFENEAPAVKDFGGILITNKNEVEVECMPQDLPHEIIVDLTKLANVDDSILVKDLHVNAGVELLDQPEDSIIMVAPPAAEEVEPVVSEAEAVAAVEATGEKTESAEGETTKEEKKSE